MNKMFNEIRIFSKINNVIQSPNYDWTSKTIIHCSFELNLGFGTSKVVWNFGNSIKLIHLISYFKGLHNFIIDLRETQYSFELKNDERVYYFDWAKSEAGQFEITVSSGYSDSKCFMLQKHFGIIQMYEFKELFFVDILTLLLETKNEVRINIGELIFDRNNNVDYEYKIGQRVKTIVGHNVKTERSGIVRNKWYHDKDKTTMYQILHEGKKIEKRYYPADLCSME